MPEQKQGTALDTLNRFVFGMIGVVAAVTEFVAHSGRKALTLAWSLMLVGGKREDFSVPDNYCNNLPHMASITFTVTALPRHL